MTYEVDYIVKVVNANSVQAIKEMAAAVNMLGPGVQVLDRLNKRIANLNKNLTSKQRRLTIDTSPAERSLTALENRVNRIQQKLHLVSTMGGGKGSGGGNNASGSKGSRTAFQPRDMWKSGGSLYARGNQAPRIPLPEGQVWRKGKIPLEAFNKPELQMWRQLENEQARLRKRMNQRFASAWNAAGGKTGTGKSLTKYALEQAQKKGLAEHSLWKQGNKLMRYLQHAWVNSYDGAMSSPGNVPKSPIPMPFADKGMPTGGVRRAGFSSAKPNNLGYKLFGPTPLTNNGGMAMDMLKGMGIAYGISGLGQLMSSIINDAVEYENTITTVRNILMSNEQSLGFQGRFSSMQNTIRDVGKRTKFKVTEVADAARFLAMAGLQSEAIKTSIPVISDIALIGDTDLGETADLMTNVMTAYNISPYKMRNVANVMTRTFTKANVTLPEIAESYQYAASLLSAGGIDFEEATAAIGILGDAGIKGSQAGTTMRTIMSNIVNPRGKIKQEQWKRIGVSRYDENGNAKSLNDIFNELYDKRLSVSDFYKLFDKTAAQGAVALAMHIDKWNDIVKDNFMSDGLSEELADAKKNTIKGLWAQLTSALSDDGLEGFGVIQENIQAMLRNITSYLNSAAGKEKVIEIFEVFWDFVKIIGNATKYLFGFFNKFSGIITFWMKVQLAIWPLVKTFTTIKSILLAFSGIGRIVGLIGVLSMNLRTLMLTMGSFKALGALGYDWLASTFTGGLRSRKYRLGSPGGINSNTGAPNYSSTWGGGVSYMGSSASGTGVYSSGVPVGEKPPKANKKFWKGRKKAAVGTGLAGMLGMGLGSMVGDSVGGYINGEGSSTIGSIVGGVAGAALMTSAGSWLAGAAPALLTNPVGWGVLAVGALVAVGASLWNAQKAIKKANEKSIEWAKTINNLYLDQIDWTKDNAIVVANMRVTTNSLFDQNEQLRAGIKNWDAWWQAQNKPAENNPFDFKPAEAAWGAKMGELMENADRARSRNETWRKRWKTMFGENSVNGNTFSIPGTDFSYTTEGKVSQDDAVRLALMERGAAMGMDPNKEDYNPFYATFANALPDKIWSMLNHGQWDSTIDTMLKTYVPEHNTGYDDIDFGTTEKIQNNIAAIGSTQYYREPTIANMKKEAAKYNELASLLYEHEKTGVIDRSAMLTELNKMYAPYFSDRFGDFGSDTWKQNMADYMYTSDGLADQEHVAQVLHVWSQLNRLFDIASPSNKKVLAPFLDRDLFESILPKDIKLPDGGIVSGDVNAEAFNRANEKYIRKEYTNAFGQKDLAWFRVNGDNTIATQPYFGSDLISNIGETSRIPFSGKVFDIGVPNLQGIGPGIASAYKYIIETVKQANSQGTNVSFTGPAVQIQNVTIEDKEGKLDAENFEKFMTQTIERARNAVISAVEPLK